MAFLPSHHLRFCKKFFRITSQSMRSPMMRSRRSRTSENSRDTDFQQKHPTTFEVSLALRKARGRYSLIVKPSCRLSALNSFALNRSMASLLNCALVQNRMQGLLARSSRTASINNKLAMNSQKPRRATFHRIRGVTLFPTLITP